MCTTWAGMMSFSIICYPKFEDGHCDGQWGFYIRILLTLGGGRSKLQNVDQFQFKYFIFQNYTIQRSIFM